MTKKLIIAGFDVGAHRAIESSSILFDQFMPMFGERASWISSESDIDQIVKVLQELPDDKFAIAIDIGSLSIEELDLRTENQRYLFVYSSPENVFFNAYKAANHDIAKANLTLEAWLVASEKMLKFVSENADRCALVHVCSVNSYFEDFKGILSSLAEEHIAVELSDKSFRSPAIESQVTALVDDFSVYEKVYEKIQLCASLPGEDFFAGKSKCHKVQFLAKKALEYIEFVEENVSRNSELESIITSVQAENELAIQQIHQLQEELERYYFKYEGIQSISSTSPAVLSRSLDFSRASSVRITGGYQDGGYKDLHLKVTNVILPDGRQFRELSCKLVKNGNSAAIELRDSDENLKDAIKYWPDSMMDEHGRYILLSPSISDQSKFIINSDLRNLCTSDRQIIFGLVKILCDHFSSSCVEGLFRLPTEDVSQWRSVAVDLEKRCQKADSYISLESVELKEEFVDEAYSHLWLRLISLQYKKAIFTNFEFKFAIAEDVSTQRVLLEFREVENARPPFFSWPPSTTDKFGPKLVADITPRQNSIKVMLGDNLRSEDKELLAALIEKLPDIVAHLGSGDYESKRGWASWIDAVNRLRDMPITFENDKKKFLRRAKARIIR